MNKFDKILRFYLLISVILLSGGLIFFYFKLSNLEKQVSELSAQNVPATVSQDQQEQKVLDTCGENCKNEIAKEVSEAIASNSAKTKTTTTQVVTPSVTLPKQKSTAYIPLSGPVTTTSTTWVDAPGTDFWVDVANDYSGTTWISWEASLSVANGNGQAFARLFDVTHGIGVNGSEISSTNNSDLTTVSSSNLAFWAGRNQYRVQVKSLNSFVVTFASGRVKVNY